MSEIRYFKNPSTNQIHGFDLSISGQAELMNSTALTHSWEEVTGVWPPPLNPTEFLLHAEQLIQENLDKGAQSWGYDSLLSAASYVASTSAIFKAEANSLVGWRDAVWLWANNVAAGVKSGQTQMPSSPQAIADAMPKIPTRPIQQ